MSLSLKAKSFVENLYKDKLSSEYVYHNFRHTSFVLNSLETILDSVQELSPEDREKAILAAWFHDSGYTVNAENHEEESAKIMTDFLRQEGKDEQYISDVATLILSTKLCSLPSNFLEKALKDADTAHFGNVDYPTISALLRREWELTGCRVFTNKKWDKENLNLLKNLHSYHTDFAKENWELVKQDNIRIIEQRLEQKKQNAEEKSEQKEENKLLKTDRSVDTMFRVTLNNHTRLSNIADTKANILLSVNAIIISVCLSVLVPKLDSPGNAHLVIPTFILVAFSVVTIIFAILSTKPNVTKNKFTKADIDARKVNLLFFGNFNQLKLNEFLPAMRDMLSDKPYLYDTLIQDLHSLGGVLDRKYRLLSITYKIFMAGIITSVIAFVVAFKSI
ncbi:MAG: DUF5706 domain-containing protein [Cruoricaptor ignavus]|nr:DUF5706 domain-containing protein [Cruoricaptor ignavus]